MLNEIISPDTVLDLREFFRDPAAVIVYAVVVFLLLVIAIVEGPSLWQSAKAWARDLFPVEAEPEAARRESLERRRLSPIVAYHREADLSVTVVPFIDRRVRS